MAGSKTLPTTCVPAETQPCRACGKQLMFVRTQEGATVGLDLAELVYTRVWDPDTDTGFWMQDRTGETYVRHTCAGRK